MLSKRIRFWSSLLFALDCLVLAGCWLGAWALRSSGWPAGANGEGPPLSEYLGVLLLVPAFWALSFHWLKLDRFERRDDFRADPVIPTGSADLADYRRSGYDRGHLVPAADMAWSDIPTCKEAGVNVEYQMLRGIFMSPDVKPDEVTYYVELFKKVMATPDWQEFMDKGAFNATTMSGDAFKPWVAAAEAKHKELMQEAGFLAK